MSTKNRVALVVAFVALAILGTGCMNSNATSPAVWWNPLTWGDSVPAKPADTNVTLGICTEVHPGWQARMDTNKVDRARFDAWSAAMVKAGYKVILPSKCSFPVDGHTLAPNATIKDLAPTQLVTSYAADGKWFPSVYATYTLDENVSVEFVGAQGDAPIAVKVEGGKVHLQSDFSNGVSALINVRPR